MIHELGKEARENPGRPLSLTFAAALCIPTVLVGVGLAGTGDTVVLSRSAA
jgi:hypothetical protein